ncbi:hypothetical protein B0H16DRAFT_668019 [Mycena metata]|uniref:HNH nuclease domain-containing protein n=1 Tax=Mycena metata TaxID=1033252 RepID=A0AAD7J660_9AGAR|nr:hypothetical protein B0H16DRAFT_668019 [Mycena metata]
MSISVVHRILSHRVQAETVLLLGPFTSTTEYAELPPVRKFTFYISLRPRPGYQAVNSKYSGWIPWLRPQRDHDLRFAFAHGNWATVRLFREVLDAVLGKHLNQTPDTVAIFRDPSCSTVVNEDDNLEGDFFIALNTVEAQELPRLNFHSPAGKRDPKFASAVKKRHGHCCTFSTAIQRFPEDDLEAAHIFPRLVDSSNLSFFLLTTHHSPGHIIFLLLLKRFCPDTSVRSIDHFCNGLALWVALHRPWDDHRAAISVLRRVRAFLLQSRCLIGTILAALAGRKAARSSLRAPAMPHQLTLDRRTGP